MHRLAKTLPALLVPILGSAAACRSDEARFPTLARAPSPRLPARAIDPAEEGPLAEEPPFPSDLESILGRIAAANPTLGGAREHLALARAAKREADAARWPELSLALGYLATDEPAQAFGLLMNQEDLTLGPAFDPTPGTIENWRKELRLDWALVAPGREPARRAAGEEQQAAGLFARAVERRLLNAGVQQWLDWHAARALEAVALESVAVVERRLEETGKRAGEGAALRADVLRLETRLAAARQSAARARLAVRTTASALRALMGLLPAGELAEPPEADPLGSFAAGLELEGEALPALLARAERERLDLAAARHQARAAAHQRDAAEDQHWPSLGFFAAYDVDGSSPGIDQDLGSTTVGVGLRWPLSLRTGARIERAAAGEREELQRVTALAQEIAREVHDAWAAVDVAQETLSLASAAVGAAEEAYRIVAQAHDAGGATVTDVLEAEDAQRQARVALVAARAGLAIARTRLVGATGGVR